MSRSLFTRPILSYSLISAVITLSLLAIVRYVNADDAIPCRYTEAVDQTCTGDINWSTYMECESRGNIQAECDSNPFQSQLIGPWGQDTTANFTVAVPSVIHSCGDQCTCVWSDVDDACTTIGASCNTYPQPDSDSPRLFQTWGCQEYYDHYNGG
jgi:hypothetical protein